MEPAPPQTEPAHERGVSYGVSGAPYIEETLVSAQSLKRCMPELPLSLVTDRLTADNTCGPSSR